MPRLLLKKNVYIETIRTYFKAHSFIQNVTKLFIGNISAQALAMATAPIISRLYDPEDFGIMATITSVMSVFSIMACLRFERAIMLPKEDADAENLLFLCLLSSFFVSMISIIVILFFGGGIANLLGEPAIRPWLWFVPPGVFLFGTQESLTYWFSRKKQFGMVSVRQFTSSFWAVTPKIIAGFAYGSSALWLLIGNTNGPLSASMVLTWKYFRGKKWKLPVGLSKEKMLSLAAKYKEFPIYSSWTALINAFSQNLIVFLLSHYFSPLIVGYFALANTMLRRPLDFISESVSKVLLEKTARSHAMGEPLGQTFIKSTLGLAAVGFAPLTILFVFGPQIFSFFFGERWLEAGTYARVLAPWLFFSFISPPANQIITVFRKLRFNLVFHIAIMVARVAAFVLGMIFFDGPYFPMAFFSGISVIFIMFYLWYAFKLSTQVAPQKDSA